MSDSMSKEMRAEPNLTPLLDVVFQLITFFMLVINFSNENYDARVRLPVATSARPLEEGEKVSEDRLVLNVDKQGHLLMLGELMPQHRALVKLNLKAAGIKPPADGSMPTTIVLRADRDTPFSMLFSLITACQTQGFRKFALKAMSGT